MQCKFSEEFFKEMVEKMKEEAKEADGLEKKDYQEVDIVDEQ